MYSRVANRANLANLNYTTGLQERSLRVLTLFAAGGHGFPSLGKQWYEGPSLTIAVLPEKQ